MSARLSGQDVYDYQLSFDARGRISQKIETLGGVSTTHEYEYDVTGRLIEEWRDGGLVQAFSYDANDNRTGHIEGQVHTSITYDAQDRLETYGDRIYTFDDNGTLDAVIDDNTIAFTVYDYDVFGQLRGVDLPGGTRISYDIDPLGRRAARHIDGAFDRGWLYKDALNPIAEVDAQGNVTTRFVYGTRPHVPDYMVTAGHTYRLISDHLGSVRLVIDTANGHVAQRLDYDAFGRVLEDTNPGFQPFGFAGGLYDADTGLVRFGARDYDAFTGRWTAKDPIGFGGGDANLYGYVGQDPISQYDPTGKIVLKALVALGLYSAVVGGVIIVQGHLDASVANSEWDTRLKRGDFVPGFPGGQDDAFRHCFWTCRMTRSMGSGPAWLAGTGHEIRDFSQDPADYRMDMHNNRCGRAIGRGPNPPDCSTACMDAINQGFLMTLNPANSGGGSYP